MGIKRGEGLIKVSIVGWFALKVAATKSKVGFTPYYEGQGN